MTMLPHIVASVIVIGQFGFMSATLHAATRTKANNSDNLNLTTSWSNGNNAVLLVELASTAGTGQSPSAKKTTSDATSLRTISAALGFPTRCFALE